MQEGMQMFQNLELMNLATYGGTAKQLFLNKKNQFLIKKSFRF